MPPLLIYLDRMCLKSHMHFKTALRSFAFPPADSLRNVFRGEIFSPLRTSLEWQIARCHKWKHQQRSSQREICERWHIGREMDYTPLDSIWFLREGERRDSLPCLSPPLLLTHSYFFGGWIFQWRFGYTHTSIKAEKMQIAVFCLNVIFSDQNYVDYVVMWLIKMIGL